MNISHTGDDAGDTKSRIEDVRGGISVVLWDCNLSAENNNIRLYHGFFFIKRMKGLLKGWNKTAAYNTKKRIDSQGD